MIKLAVRYLTINKLFLPSIPAVRHHEIPSAFIVLRVHLSLGVSTGGTKISGYHKVFLSNDLRDLTLSSCFVVLYYT